MMMVSSSNKSEIANNQEQPRAIKSNCLNTLSVPLPEVQQLQDYPEEMKKYSTTSVSEAKCILVPTSLISCSS